MGRKRKLHRTLRRSLKVLGAFAVQSLAEYVGNLAANKTASKSAGSDRDDADDARTSSSAEHAPAHKSQKHGKHHGHAHADS